MNLFMKMRLREYWISLRDHDHSNAGHVTFMQFKNQWIMHMDFRLNKGKAKERNDSALRFF
jgi:hypothetical protein